MKKAWELYRSEGAYLATWSLLDHVSTRLRSLMVGRYLGARRLRLGAGYQIRGARYMQIGEGFCSQQGLWLEAVHEYQGKRYDPRIKIGKNVSCSQHVHISCIGELTIGDNVLIGSAVYLGDHSHGRYRGDLPDSPETPPTKRPLFAASPLFIDDNVFIGDKVTIAGGFHIGRGSIVAANSVVTSSVPPMCIVAGVPAKIKRMYDVQARTWNSTATSTPAIAATE